VASDDRAAVTGARDGVRDPRTEGAGPRPRPGRRGGGRRRRGERFRPSDEVYGTCESGSFADYAHRAGSQGQSLRCPRADRPQPSPLRPHHRHRGKPSPITATSRHAPARDPGRSRWRTAARCSAGFDRQPRAPLLSLFVTQRLRGLIAKENADDLQVITALIDSGAITVRVAPNNLGQIARAGYGGNRFRQVRSRSRTRAE
jgi:hypothetical protein